MILKMLNKFLNFQLAIHRYFPGGANGKEFSSVAQSCRTLCDPMDSSTPGLPVHHQLPEFTQAHDC